MVRYANPAAENLLTAGARSLIGQPFLGFFAERTELERSLEEARVIHWDYSARNVTYVRTGREPVPLSCTVTRIDAFGLGAARRAAPDRAGAAPRARGAPRSEQQANRELIRNLAHEIKNPLGGLRGSAQLLERELERPELREYTQVIIKEADRLQSLMDRMLTPHRAPRIEPLSMHEVLERVRSLVRAEFGIEIERDYDPSLPELMGDREQLIQAVLNIARNAAQAGARDRHFPHARAAQGHHPQAAPQAGIRIASHRRRPGRAGGDPGQDLQSAGLGQGRRHRAGALARADVRPLPPRRHRVRVAAGPNNIQDPAAADMKPVWIIDDDRSIRWVFEKALSREGIAFNSFSSAQEALDALGASTPEVLVSDIRMPGRSGLELLQAVKQRHPAVPVIVMTAYSDLDSAVAAFQGGAYEYLPKPFDVDQAVELIRRALDESRRETQADRDARSTTKEILGQAPAMQEVFRAIGRLSQSSATVLITGESGTGKELVARALHRHSARAAQPFVAINTAAMPKDLLETELFGHERGSFTGAQQQRRGRFEQAEGGTLFLDEIGDMPPELQTRLLRVLSDGTFYRVGGHQPIKANVRVIAATHQNLEQRVREGTFREDLYHRLNVIRLRLPSLRERAEDIPLLAQAFPRQEREAARRRAQAPRRRCARASRAPGISRQRAPAREPLPLAHGDGAGAGDRPGRPAAGVPRPGRDRAPPTGSRALEQEAERRLARGETGILDALGAPVRARAHHQGAGAHRRAAHRRREPARHGPQHDHPQDPGAGHRRRRIGDGPD